MSQAAAGEIEGADTAVRRLRRSRRRRSAYVDELSDAAIAATVGQHHAVPSPHSEIHFHQFGGAVARVGDDAASGDRSAQYVRGYDPTNLFQLNQNIIP